MPHPALPRGEGGDCGEAGGRQEGGDLKGRERQLAQLLAPKGGSLFNFVHLGKSIPTSLQSLKIEADCLLVIKYLVYRYFQDLPALRTSAPFRFQHLQTFCILV